MSNARKALAEPDGTGPYGPGHRCQHCGTRIDLAHTSDTDPGEYGWVHDHTGYQECADNDRHQRAAQVQRERWQLAIAAKAAASRRQARRSVRGVQSVRGVGMVRILPPARAQDRTKPRGKAS
jgi:hypothetical protein